jgi:mRNA interferase MazF
MISDRWDVVVVPFPFSEGPAEKKRPALTLSSQAFNRAGHTVLAMITTRSHRPWPGDTDIVNYDAAGLPSPCLVRLRVFALDNRLILRRLGRFAHPDAASVEQNLRHYLF